MKRIVRKFILCFINIFNVSKKIFKSHLLSVFTNGSCENKPNSEEVNNGEEEKSNSDEDDRTDDAKLLQIKVY